MYPLSSFSPEKRAEIERLASGDTAPPAYISLGSLAQIQSRARYEWERRRKAERKRVRRLRIAERDGWICGICGTQIADMSDLHIDHIVPLCKGGKSNSENLQAAHACCNIRKGGKLDGVV
jgi:5-methylcytosine-specific restriction endonuclease McrA